MCSLGHDHWAKETFCEGESEQNESSLQCTEDLASFKTDGPS